MIECDEFQKHILTCTKHKRCPYEKLGDCQFDPSGTETVQQHLQSKHDHDSSLISSSLTIIQENERLKQENYELLQSFKDLLNKVHEMEKELNSTQTFIYESKSRIQERDEEIFRLKEQISQWSQKNSTLLTKEEYDDRIRKLEILMNKNQSLVTQKPLDFQSLSTTHELVTKVEKQQAIMNANLADTDLKIALLEGLSTNGHQLWKIDNFQYRHDQATNGKIYALHSPPCYTKVNGYKFCVRAYINGDGLGKGTHLSIYFVLMKHHYDDLLKWPFTKKITFKLLNLKNPSKSKSETFTTDKHSSSFKKPEKDMNIAAGCPKFLQQNLMLSDGFVLDDSIIIETTVEDV